MQRKTKMLLIALLILAVGGCAHVVKSGENKQNGQRNISFTHLADDGTEILTVTSKLPEGEALSDNKDAIKNIDKYYEDVKEQSYRWWENELCEFANEDYLLSSQNKGNFREYSVSEDYSITYEDEEFVSILRKSISYTGGLHENEAVYCETFSKSTGEKLTLDYFFKPNSNYEEFILNKLNNILNERRKQDETIYFDDAGEHLSYAPEQQLFYLTEESLVFVYPSYILSAYSSGTQYFDIAWDELSDVLI